jgi:hypothetical protein
MTERNLLQSVRHNTIFINPNSYGPDGYSLIPWLLLFYEKVAVYAPVSEMIRRSNEKNLNESFTPTEFRDAIIEGEVIPVAFDTFTNASTRKSNYPTAMSVQSEFDRDLINPNCELGLSFRPLDSQFKDRHSSEIAINYIQCNNNLQHTLSKIQQDFQKEKSTTLPDRYQQFLNNELELPKPLAKLNLPSERQLPTMVVYDLLNERYAMSATGAGVHFTSKMEFVLQSLHGITLQSPSLAQHADRAKLKSVALGNSESERALTEILSSIGVFKETRKERLSLKCVRNFRKYFWDDFLHDLSNIMYKNTDASDPVLRQQMIQYNVEKFCKLFVFRFNLSPRQLLRILKFIDYGAVSDALDNAWQLAFNSVGLNWQKFNDTMYWSFDKRGRWAYSLFGRRQEILPNVIRKSVA